MKIALPLLFVALGATTYAQEYCSLTVNVVDSNGEQAQQGRVTVKEQNGRLTIAEYRPGGVRFCGLGITPVTVTIGSVDCDRVTVRNVDLIWGKTSVIKLIYDREVCVQDGPPIRACEILFRFVDEEGNWVPGVSLSPPVDLTRPPRSDTHGRLHINLVAGKEIQSMTQSAGHLPKEIHLTCTQELLHHEQIITLHKNK